LGPVVALRRLVPRSLLLAGAATVAACGGGNDGGDGGDPFDQLLDLVPASAITDEATLQYVDMDLVWARLGVGADPAQRLDNFGRTGRIETYARTPALFREQAVMVDEARAEAGFDVTAIRQEIAVDLPPDELRVAKVAVPPQDVLGALQSDPLWSDRLAEVESDGGTYFDWTAGDDELAVDPQRRSPMRPLGTGGQLAVAEEGEGSLIVRTKRSATMTATLATVDGDEPSLAEESPFAPALDALGDGEVVQAVGLLGPLRVDAREILGPTAPQAQVDRLEELLAEQPSIQPYGAILLAEVVEDDDYRTELLVVHGRDEAAAANVDPIERQLTDGISSSTQQPLREILPPYSVEQDGDVVRITFVAETESSFRDPLEALVTRDLLTIVG